MALKTPNLDDRKFQDIVREARSKIPLYCPKWTDYNLSDPGITLIELFAWMVDMLLYRVNRVPEKTYIKFMELIGLRLETPKPARVDITFRLSAPQPQDIRIPEGTQMSYDRTETQEAIPFTTDADLIMMVPDLMSALTTLDDKTFNDRMPALKNPDQHVTVFKPVPEENNALYLGFRQNLVNQTIILTIDSNIEGIGVDPDNPPLAWEYWDSEHETWMPLKLESDTTGGLNTAGAVTLYMPSTTTLLEVNGQRACWIRCRATKPRPGQLPYVNSPKIKSIIAENIGGTVPASHCLRVSQELLGRSNGAPGQKYLLRNFPVLSREPGETVEVESETEGVYESWKEVTDFSESSPDDYHFTLDAVSGEVQFGPLIRQPSGEERQYGRIPSLGRTIRFTSYRWGGGVIGNVGRRTIIVLKSSIPYIASVTNFNQAIGGTDPETLENAMLRAPKIVRNQTRAVTADDFEFLALQASEAIARAKSLVPGMTGESQTVPPGVVRVLLIPITAGMNTRMTRENFELPSRIRADVQKYLDERRLLAMRVEIGSPEYQPVAVAAKIKMKPGSDLNRVKASVEERLYKYINPVYGGPKGQGWPFGRSVFPSEIYSVIQNTPDVEYIEDVKLFRVDPVTGQRQAETIKINVPPHGVVCSDEHIVKVTEMEPEALV